ncbi:F0F1 ATP synthase subunit B [Buchnera aphidicola]|uniref:ATP synthase subunit b n=1 Tax=Buchnera aphidicola (Artemisaphis artemisicola) TaxID=1241836 RepID=A0A4D6XP28_9GAMM|nr:F0F1 ATP synthase subunit B [Buchnera aphidicola]QCI15711.1 F0F1 ATP synthase subunit B [Buchnera aphidicola (Artemisaphis artemisicola)]
MNLNATILGQTISFFLFVWFCMKYIWPPIICAIENRQKEIKESLINAKQAQDKLHIIEKTIDEQLKKAKQKASNILNEAHSQKLLILEEAKKNALLESKKIIMHAQSEINIEMIHARKKLFKEILDLSLAIAEKVIKKNISKNENKELVEQLIISLSKEKNYR